MRGLRRIAAKSNSGYGGVLYYVTIYCPAMIAAFLKRHAWWLIPLILVDIILFRWLLTRTPQETEEEAFNHAGIDTMAIAAQTRDAPTGLRYVYPTDQHDLWNTESVEVYQPTASGRVESALYGSVRTRSFGGRLLPAFHMGIDIAALERDRYNRPLDSIYAVADGRVAYINAVAGNSNYGLYIVLLHEDPLGKIYTLYSHLAKIEPGLRDGMTVKAGDTLGIMGHTASTGIPRSRAHLHFEIGVVNTLRFTAWYRTQELPMIHGTYHGYNLTGIDPLAVLGEKEEDGEIHFSMKAYLEALEPAFRMIFRTSKTPDYFSRYTDLWQGPAFTAGAILMEVSEAGVPLSGRMASLAEVQAMGRDRVQVLEVNEDILGRNGRRHVVRRNGEWTLGRNGHRWLEILTY